MPVKRRWKVMSCLSLALALQAISLRANWSFDGESGFLYDSNLSRSDRSADERDDAAWETKLATRYGFQLTDDLRLTVAGEIESRVWTTYEAFDSVAPDLAGNLRYRFGLGAEKPWVRLESRAGYVQFNEDWRSGWSFREGLRAGKSLTDRLALEAAYSYENFSTDDVIFKQESHSVSARGNFALTSSTQISAGYTYRYGDVISHAVPPRPDIVAIASAFGPVQSFDTPYVAYRFQASTHACSVAFSQTVSDFAAIQLAYEWEYTTGNSLHYINNIVEAKVAVSF